MESPIPSEEGLVCQTCGAEGYTNAFIYCVRCLGYVIHRYCLAVIPETNDEFVKWYCDDCKPPLPYHFTSPPKHDPPHSQSEDPPNSALVKTTHPKNKQKKNSLKKKKLAFLVEAGKDDKITRCVVLGLAKREHKSLQVQEKVATCFQKDEVPLLGKDKVSLETAKSNDQKCVETSSNSLLKEASAYSDSGVNQITPQCAELDNNCFSMESLKKRKLASLVEAGKDNECVAGLKKITRCVVLGLAKWEHKSLQVKEKVATTFQKDEVPLLGKDEVSLETAKSNDQKRAETSANSLLKEASANSDSGANQITPQCAELDNNCFSMKGIVRRKRDTTRVAAKTKKHNTEKSSEHSSCESSCTDAALKNEEDSTHTEEGLKCVPDHDKLVSNSSSTENQLIKSKEYTGSAYASQSDYMKIYIPYKPDPVWRGSFNIIQTDYDLFEGIAGHLSLTACEKVSNEATTLPSMLSLEMDSRVHLWPNSFMRSMPSVENIALYFFPGDMKNERDYEQLVNDMIDKDLAMKTSSKNADMLIFTSRVLPNLFWRVQGKHYLWGVFKSKQKDVPAANHSDGRVLSSTSGNEVTSETETLSYSPQSPLCSYR